jgi:hypothetical protein
MNDETRPFPIPTMIVHRDHVRVMPVVRRKRHTLRTVVISVASTLTALFIALCVLGTVMPNSSMPHVAKSTTIKTVS